MEKVTISNLQGESGLVNVVRYFLNNGSEFLIYSLNEVDESGYTRLYVTKLSGVDGNYTADTLNDTEWADVKNLVKIIAEPKHALQNFSISPSLCRCSSRLQIFRLRIC